MSFLGDPRDPRSKSCFDYRNTIILVGVLYAMYLSSLVYGLCCATKPKVALLCFIIPYILHFIGIGLHWCILRRPVYPEELGKFREVLKVLDGLLVISLCMALLIYGGIFGPGFKIGVAACMFLILGIVGVFGCFLKVLHISELADYR